MSSFNANLFINIPAQLPQELFQEILAADGLRVERIVSQGHVTPAGEWYDQEKNEWVLLLEGEAVVAIADREPVHLTPGDHLYLPARLRHRVEWTAPAINTIWLAVHF